MYETEKYVPLVESLISEFLRINPQSAHLCQLARTLPLAAQTPLRACTEMHFPAADSLLTLLSITARGSAPAGRRCTHVTQRADADQRV